ncbi:GNAT family N-acetyltransferase [Bifidobacterium stellenboschense]|uniref:Acetyl transferase n=1 Tax=Bifidobacterium stellenboschense TaxID=762211 RepID=A0A087DE21_9BIFI|nr:GNAT family N-acetyltransferase [Bifidobacterium stellenboschense]KFI93771.1 acetyl transferase [Bifidobacterium stellenboschense]
MAANNTATTSTATHGTTAVDTARHIETAAASAAVTYRAVTWNDLDAIVDAFYATWGVDEPGDPHIARLTSRHFVLHYLEPATRGEIAEKVDGTFLGVTLSRVAGRPVLFPQVSGELARVNAELDATPDGADALARTEAWHALEERMEADIAINDRTPAELELFVVAPAARGHGVGGTLWRNLLASFAEAGAPRYYLHTDSSCDVGFYEHKGLARVAERYAKDHPGEHVGDGEDIYIYEGEVAA